MTFKEFIKKESEKIVNKYNAVHIVILLLIAAINFISVVMLKANFDSLDPAFKFIALSISAYWLIAYFEKLIDKIKSTPLFIMFVCLIVLILIGTIYNFPTEWFGHSFAVICLYCAIILLISLFLE